MIEILVTLLITLIGLLGIAALQVKAQQAQFEAYQRAQAIIIMNDITDRMLANQKTASCFDFTDASTGSPFIGAAAASGNLTLPAGCAASTSAYNTLADDAIEDLDNLLKGTAETKSGTSVGAMVGARACISYDAATEAINPSTGGAVSGTGEYTIAVAWQGTTGLFTPTVNCANGLYGDENQRRVISTIVRFADLD